MLYTDETTCTQETQMIVKGRANSCANITANLIKGGKLDGNSGLNYPLKGLLEDRKFSSIILKVCVHM